MAGRASAWRTLAASLAASASVLALAVLGAAIPAPVPCADERLLDRTLVVEPRPRPFPLRLVVTPQEGVATDWAAVGALAAEVYGVEVSVGPDGIPIRARHDIDANARWAYREGEIQLASTAPSTVVHELGHAMGLRHQEDLRNVMHTSPDRLGMRLNDCQADHLRHVWPARPSQSAA